MVRDSIGSSQIPQLLSSRSSKHLLTVKCELSSTRKPSHSGHSENTDPQMNSTLAVKETSRDHKLKTNAFQRRPASQNSSTVPGRQTSAKCPIEVSQTQKVLQVVSNSGLPS